MKLKGSMKKRQKNNIERLMRELMVHGGGPWPVVQNRCAPQAPFSVLNFTRVCTFPIKPKITCDMTWHDKP